MPDQLFPNRRNGKRSPYMIMRDVIQNGKSRRSASIARERSLTDSLVKYYATVNTAEDLRGSIPEDLVEKIDDMRKEASDLQEDRKTVSKKRVSLSYFSWNDDEREK